MRPFEDAFTQIASLPKGKPNFQNIRKILNQEKPDRYTLFEFFLNDPLEQRLAGWEKKPEGEEAFFQCKIQAFTNAGYDYTTIHSSDFYFHHKNNHHGQKSVSVNEGATVVDWESYETYEWPDPIKAYNGRIERIEPYLPEGMKFFVCGPSGVLENVTALTGYDNLCYMLADDEELVEEIFGRVGQSLLDYYQMVLDYDSVGGLIANDDWGFNTQTMLRVEDMRKYVFPWYKKITALAHKAGKPVVLHSCGNLDKVYDDIIHDIKIDGKHSYEDKILPVEQAYERFKGKLAVMGGIDVDFVCRKPLREVYERGCRLLEQTGGIGYGLGTGNSIASYVPDEQYLAMISAVVQNRD